MFVVGKKKRYHWISWINNKLICFRLFLNDDLLLRWEMLCIICMDDEYIVTFTDKVLYCFVFGVFNYDLIRLFILS